MSGWAIEPVRTRERMHNDTHAGKLEAVSRLRLQQMTHREIAQELGISSQHVFELMQEIRALWRASAVRNWDEIKAEEIARIDELERHYWEGWRRSCELLARQTIHVQQKQVPFQLGPGETVIRTLKTMRASTQTEHGVGDPRFLDGIHRCIERRCAILGLNAPQTVDIELRIRQAARAEGADEDAAVAEARRLIAEYARAK